MTQAICEQDHQWRERAAQKRRERSRVRILTAARELFQTHGYQAVSVERIAEAAGVGPATIYNHFGSKATIVAYLIKDVFEDVQEATEADITAHVPFVQAVQRYFERIAHMAMREPLFAHGFVLGIMESGLVAVVPESERDPRVVLPLPDPLIALLEAGKERGDVFPDADSQHSAAMIINAFLIRLVRNEEPLATAHAVAQFFLNGVSSKPATFHNL